MTPARLLGAGHRTAVQLRTQLHEGLCSVESIVREAFEYIDSAEPAVQAWKVIDRDGAIARARRLDRRHACGETMGTLFGIPMAVKDIFDTASLPTTYGSPIYCGHQPCEDAEPVRRVLDGDAVVMGKTVTTEFAFFAPGPTMNPWDPSRTPGGSSSGSAAAVAAGMVPLAFGTQTAGSLIRPASYCGVYALKPTYGRFSLSGVKPFAPSLDTLGWIARTAQDLELLRAALLGIRFEPLETPAPGTLRIGACKTHEWPMVDATGAAVWEHAIATLARAGVDVRAKSMPERLSGLLDAQKTIMAREASQSLARERRDAPDQLSAPLTALLDEGGRVQDSAVEAARQLARQGRDQVVDLMRDVDVLLVPAAPGQAPAGLQATGDPAHSRVWTLLGFPCVNVPGLFGSQGMPVGVQLVGAMGDERRLLQMAATVGRLLDAAASQLPEDRHA